MVFQFHFFIGHKLMKFEVRSVDAETHSLMTPFEPILRKRVQDAMIDTREEIRELFPDLVPARQPWNEKEGE